MHIAVCFWGLLRSLAYTERSIRENCFDAIEQAGHTYDVFVHSYHFNGTYSSERNHESAQQLNFSEWRRLQPYYVAIEDQDAFDATQDYASYLSQGTVWISPRPSAHSCIHAYITCALTRSNLIRTCSYEQYHRTNPLEASTVSSTPIHSVVPFITLTFIVIFRQSLGEYITVGWSIEERNTSDTFVASVDIGSWTSQQSGLFPEKWWAWTVQ